MEVYRLTREKFSRHLSGKGSSLKGARWNSPGMELIYTAANRSLAMAEVAVHMSLATIPDDYVMLTVFMPDDISLKKIREADLPPNWNAFPSPFSTSAVGDRFLLAGTYCVQQIPSAVTQGDYNFLINPSHPDYKKIKIVAREKFPFDRRIFRE